MSKVADGAGGGPAGGPNEKKLFDAAYTASTSQIDEVMSHISQAHTSIDIVTGQLDKLTPVMRENWTSPDGQAAASSTQTLSQTLAAKGEQLQQSNTALQSARAAVDKAQTYWSNQQPPPTAPTAPEYDNYDSSSGYAQAVGQYNTQQSSYDGTMNTREAAMQKQYVVLQKSLEAAGDDLAKANSLPAPHGGGSDRGGSAGGSATGGAAGGGSAGGAGASSGSGSGSSLPGAPGAPGGPLPSHTGGPGGHASGTVTTTGTTGITGTGTTGAQSGHPTTTLVTESYPSVHEPTTVVQPLQNFPVEHTSTPSVDGSLVGSTGGVDSAPSVSAGFTPNGSGSGGSVAGTGSAGGLLGGAAGVVGGGVGMAAGAIGMPAGRVSGAGAVTMGGAGRGAAAGGAVRGTGGVLAGQGGTAGTRGGTTNGTEGRGSRARATRAAGRSSGGRAAGAGGRSMSSATGAGGRGTVSASGATTGAGKGAVKSVERSAGRVAGRGTSGRGGALGAAAGRNGKDRGRRQVDDLSLVTEDEWVDEGGATDGVVR